jgi:branched-chain amino acid transport system substrate-binding protein
VSEGNFETGAADLTPIAIKAKKAKPDAIVLCATSLGDFTNIAKALKSQGEDAPVLATAAALNPTFKGLAKGAADDWVATGFRSFFYSGDNQGDPAMIKFIQENSAQGGKDDLLTATALFYDAVNIWAEGVKRAKSFDSAKVAQAIEGITGYKGILGTANFSADNHDGLDPNAMAMGKPAVTNENGLYELGG